MSLGLIDKEMHVKIESNFAEERRKFLIDHPYNPGKSFEEQDAEYTYKYWYVHLRRFLVQVSFEEQSFKQNDLGIVAKETSLVAKT